MTGCVLYPEPLTESLVMLMLKKIKERKKSNFTDDQTRVCPGSGCVYTGYRWRRLS